MSTIRQRAAMVDAAIGRGIGPSIAAHRENTIAHTHASRQPLNFCLLSNQNAKSIDPIL